MTLQSAYLKENLYIYSFMYINICFSSHPDESQEMPDKTRPYAQYLLILLQYGYYDMTH